MFDMAVAVCLLFTSGHRKLIPPCPLLDSSKQVLANDASIGDMHGASNLQLRKSVDRATRKPNTIASNAANVIGTSMASVGQ